jgi:ABC-type dipeptide/oligopeptide/nickel transport system permease subunit
MAGSIPVSATRDAVGLLAEPATPRPRRIPWRIVLPAVPVLLAVVAAVGAPWVAPHPPTAGDLGARLRPPVWQAGGAHAMPLGSDQLGRDVLSRLLWGARISVPIALAATALGAVVGSAIGLLSGYYRGPVDEVVTKLIDVQLAFPFVLFAISVIAVAGAGIGVLVVVLAIGSWVGTPGSCAGSRSACASATTSRPRAPSAPVAPRSSPGTSCPTCWRWCW